MDWLKADSTDEKFSRGTGLLLAPVSPDVQKTKPDPTFEDFNFEIHDEEHERAGEIQDNEEHREEDKEADLIPAPQADEVAELSDKVTELSEAAEQIQEAFEPTSEPPEAPIEQAENVDVNDKAWQERATGFELSLDEPPSELWTQIGEPASEDEGNEDNIDDNDNYYDEYRQYEQDYYDYHYDDDDNLEYEHGMSLQGAAYVPKAPKGASGRGRNFTERLHQTLRGRKQKAEQLREKEEENKSRHPYFSRAFIICSTLLMLLGFACLALWFIQQWTPAKINERANLKLQNGEYEEAIQLFHRGYKRYPNVLTFLTGLARAAESADHIQTATAAWEAYINSLPKDETESKKFAQLELKRLKGETIPLNNDKPKAKPEIKKPVPKLPATFGEFLREANEAYNLKIYNTAIIYFHRAMELNGSDVRAYIGLAQSYQAKGMLFDAKRILDEAKRKFKRNPTIETELKILGER